MLILAKTNEGTEFIYSIKSAHEVSKAKAKTIMDTLNEKRYQLKENEKWYIYEIGMFDSAYGYAETQKFKVRKNTITEYR